MKGIPKYPILYTFRRCPYAIRTRLAIKASQIFVELREIELKNKPYDFLKISPKGTVPVLITCSGDILEESLDIVYWALKINDPHHLLSQCKLTHKEFDGILSLLEDQFKPNLDKYKYPNRYLNINKNLHRDKNLEFLQMLENLLKGSQYINCSHLTIIDYLIFPFIRQYRNVDEKWFDCLNFPFLKMWLYDLMNSNDFLSVMKKYKIWNSSEKPVYTNFNTY